MNEFQLRALRTDDLRLLRECITSELKARAISSRVSRRIGAVASAQVPDGTSKVEIEQNNAASLLAVPHLARRKPGRSSIYLPALLKQDWSHLYNGGDPERKYYVYSHVNPLKQGFCAPRDGGGNYGGLPFYIGKGLGGRAFDLKRNQGHGRILSEIQKCGVLPERIVKILFSDLTEAKAYEIEAKLIYFFGTVYVLRTEKKKGILYNLDTPSIPSFIGQMEEYS